MAKLELILRSDHAEVFLCSLGEEGSEPLTALQVAQLVALASTLLGRSVNYWGSPTAFPDRDGDVAPVGRRIHQRLFPSEEKT